MHTYILHSSVKYHRFRFSTMPNSFLTPAINPEKWSKRPFFDERANSSARGTGFTVNDSLYSRPVFPLSNGVYRMSLRLSVGEQSARDAINVRHFFAALVFSVSNVKTMAHIRTCQRHSIGRRGRKFNATYLITGSTCPEKITLLRQLAASQ